MNQHKNNEEFQRAEQAFYGQFKIKYDSEDELKRLLLRLPSEELAAIKREHELFISDFNRRAKGAP